MVIVEDKVFYFDKIFAPATKQSQLYETLIEPMVDKMLKGFYCTVLAYGQTGTGKSYTMGLQSEVSLYLHKISIKKFTEFYFLGVWK